MNQASKIVKSRYSVLYQPVQKLRRKLFELEEKFEGVFLVPELLPIPDDAPYEIPRIEFRSKHGFSTLKFTPIRVDLVTNYDNDFGTDIDKCFNYITNKSENIKTAIELIQPEIAIVALAITMRFVGNTNDEKAENLKILETLLSGDFKEKPLRDLKINYSIELEKQYYMNITLNNYKIYGSDKSLPSPYPRISELKLQEMGIEKEVEINDKLSYNLNIKNDGLSQLDKYLTLIKPELEKPI